MTPFFFVGGVLHLRFSLLSKLGQAAILSAIKHIGSVVDIAS